MFICTAAQIALLQLTWHLTVHKAKEQQGGKQRDEDGVDGREVKRTSAYDGLDVLFSARQRGGCQISGCVLMSVFFYAQTGRLRYYSSLSGTGTPTEECLDCFST